MNTLRTLLTSLLLIAGITARAQEAAVEGKPPAAVVPAEALPEEVAQAPEADKPAADTPARKRWVPPTLKRTAAKPVEEVAEKAAPEQAPTKARWIPPIRTKTPATPTAPRPIAPTPKPKPAATTATTAEGAVATPAKSAAATPATPRVRWIPPSRRKTSVSAATETPAAKATHAPAAGPPTAPVVKTTAPAPAKPAVRTTTTATTTAPRPAARPATVPTKTVPRTRTTTTAATAARVTSTKMSARQLVTMYNWIRWFDIDTNMFVTEPEYRKTMDKMQRSTEDASAALLTVFDKNSDGTLSKGEMRKIVDFTYALRVIQQYDKNRDWLLDTDELIKAGTQLSERCQSYNSMLLRRCDRNADGELSETELKTIQAERKAYDARLRPPPAGAATRAAGR